MSRATRERVEQRAHVGLRSPDNGEVDAEHDQREDDAHDSDDSAWQSGGAVEDDWPGGRSHAA
jgi:hypothetical protein